MKKEAKKVVENPPLSHIDDLLVHAKFLLDTGDSTYKRLADYKAKLSDTEKLSLRYHPKCPE